MVMVDFLKQCEDVCSALLEGSPAQVIQYVVTLDWCCGFASAPMHVAARRCTISTAFLETPGNLPDSISIFLNLFSPITE